MKNVRSELKGHNLERLCKEQERLERRAQNANTALYLNCNDLIASIYRLAEMQVEQSEINRIATRLSEYDSNFPNRLRTAALMEMNKKDLLRLLKNDPNQIKRLIG